MMMYYACMCCLLYGQLAIESYTRTIRHGHTHHLLQALPKLLTLYFSLSALPSAASTPSSTQKSSAAATNKKNYLSKVMVHLNKCLSNAKDQVPASTWYLALPQLVSRVCHVNPDTALIVRKIVIKILVAHPAQTLWSMSSLLHSLHSEKQGIARDILQQACSALLRRGDGGGADMLKRSEEVFRQVSGTVWRGILFLPYFLLLL
jgi:serine/threonine-protein kinase ATR